MVGNMDKCSPSPGERRYDNPEFRGYLENLSSNDKPEQDTEISKQAAGPFIWILGLVGITLLGLAVAGGV